jgi:hypothetical protein
MNNIIRFEEQMQMAKAFKESGLFPDLKSEAQAIVKIQAGKELGIEPFASIQGVNIVLGKPVMSANLQAGLIKKSGRYNYKVLEHNEQVCKLEFYEKWGDTWQLIGNSEYSTKEATQAGLTHKDNWKKHPKNMLFARAMSNGAKWYCADVFITGTYNESDEFETAPVVQVDNTGLDAIKAKVQEQSKPVIIEAEVVEPKPALSEEEMADWEMLLANAVDMEALIKLRDIIKNELKTSDEQFSTLKKLFLKRQKELKNG